MAAQIPTKDYELLFAYTLTALAELVSSALLVYALLSGDFHLGVKVAFILLAIFVYEEFVKALYRRSSEGMDVYFACLGCVPAPGPLYRLMRRLRARYHRMRG